MDYFMANRNYVDHCYKHVGNHSMANDYSPLPVGSHSVDNFMAYSYNLDYFCDSLVSHSLDHVMANDDYLANMCVPVGSWDMGIFISSDFTLNTDKCC